MITPQDITMNILKDTARVVDFTKMLIEQQQFLSKAQRLAGSEPSKTEKAYIDEQKIKLAQLQDIVKSWVWEAFADDPELTTKTMYWAELNKNYKITVMVEKK